jgi:hypothetical protein
VEIGRSHFFGNGRNRIVVELNHLSLGFDSLSIGSPALNLSPRMNEEARMRMTSWSILLLLAVGGSANAASFQCEFSEFSPQTGTKNDSSCAVDTTADLTAEAGKCRQNFPNMLFGECDGRSPGGTNQLICYFASQMNPPNLNITSVIDQAGVYAVAIEWIVGQSTASIVLDHKDGAKSRSVACAPN